MPVAASESRIRILPDLLVNKIAAGEVVERPASVVKELMENAIDAGAGRVAVAVEEGGRRLIRITDDGCGMSAEDLRLAVTPHATSKLLTEDDLYAIRSYGFRGEALASVAAVSHTRIVSRQRGAVEGHEVRMSGDAFEAAMAAGCPEGTTVEVRDLFFNVPARRKFLRAASTETGHIGEQFSRIALARPEIAFELSSNGRRTQNLPACGGRQERIARFYGPELASALLHVARDERGTRLEIFAGPPSHSRSTTQWQYLFVNGRFIRDRSIQHAVREAYRGLMEPDRHGVVFIFIEIDPSAVDVNVHPTKVEVRWADGQLVYSQVLSALRETFQRNDLTPRLRTGPNVDPAEQDRIRREFAESVRALGPPLPGSTGYSSQPPPSQSGVDRREFDSGMSERAEARGSPACAPGWGANPETGARPPMPDVWRPLYGPAEPAGSVAADRSGAGIPSAPGPGGEAGRGAEGDASLRPRAVQMHNLYLVAETDDGIVIIDQHALHERVMYEQLRQRIAAGPLEAQRLLLPETVRVTAGQLALLESHDELLTRLGIEVTPFGTDAVAVHAFPSLMKDTQVAGFMYDLLDLLGSSAESGDADASTQTERLIHRLLDLMACKAAVKAGDPLTADEINALLSQRHLIEKASSCPHGRPTTLRLTKADLDRQFKRT